MRLKVNGQEHEVIMLHRALYGSLERFAGIYIEHTGGEFPVWIAPVQVTVLPVSPKAHDYAATVASRLRDAGVRVTVDTRDEKLGAKIRDAELDKIPYMVVVGPRDAEAGTTSPRRKGVGDLGAMTVEALLERIGAETRNRTR